MENIKFEKSLLENNLELIAGVDEVGRGCLAGPMVVAAVVIDPKHLRTLIIESSNNQINNDVSSAELNLYREVTDSKLISPKKRAFLSEFLSKNLISFSIEVIDSKTLDEIGISQATQLGFYNAVNKLSVKPDHILTDAFSIKKYPEQIQTNIPKGDRQSLSIGAASIIGKVYRDKLMEELHKNPIYQKYNFDVHKGYGTVKHIEALKKYGPCDVHRFSFEPIKKGSLV